MHVAIRRDTGVHQCFVSLPLSKRRLVFRRYLHWSAIVSPLPPFDFYALACDMGHSIQQPAAACPDDEPQSQPEPAPQPHEEPFFVSSSESEDEVMFVDVAILQVKCRGL